MSTSERKFTSRETVTSAIADYEAKRALWAATWTDEKDLPEGTPEHEATCAAEMHLVTLPCRSLSEVRVKVAYFHHAATDQARAARDAAQNTEFDAFLGSLLGVGAGAEAGDGPTSKPWYDEIERRASILRSIVTVVTERISGTPSPQRDAIADDLLDAARALSAELHALTIEDPEHWGMEKHSATNTHAHARLGRPRAGETRIEEAFHRWKDAEARADAADSDADALAEYRALQDQLGNETPETARELAMILIAVTDRWASPLEASLKSHLNRLAGETEGV